MTTPKRGRRRILVVSHVVPFEAGAGQTRRVRYTVDALRDRFAVTFLTFAKATDATRIRSELAGVCDELVVLPARTDRRVARIRALVAKAVYPLATGLKQSNYVIGRLELTPRRVAAAVDPRSFDLVLFEYFHASAAAGVFREAGVPVAVDLHNVMWRSFEQQLLATRLPRAIAAQQVARYRAREERAWHGFDVLIAINEEEQREVQRVVGAAKQVLYTPMGIPLADWPVSWQPSQPPVLGYYGGLGSHDRERALLRLRHDVMPAVWARHPEVQLRIIGGHPSAGARALADDHRVHVTGWLDDVRPELAALTALVCPWSGRFGFRSRLVETMAIGTPVVATPDAVAGMGMRDGEGVLLAEDDAGLAAHCLQLIDDPRLATEQSRGARSTAERYDFASTYGELAARLEALITAPHR